MSTPILNIDLPGGWDSACPVLLPLGSVTVAPIYAASIGVLIPFVIFAFSIFMHMWGMWKGNVADALSNISSTMKSLERPETYTNRMRQWPQQPPL